jgi:hypothetical protein
LERAGCSVQAATGFDGNLPLAGKKTGALRRVMFRRAGIFRQSAGPGGCGTGPPGGCGTGPPGGCGTRPRASLALRYGWRRSWHQRTVMDRVRLCPTKFCTRPKPRRLEMAVTATSPPPMAGLISISRCRRRWVATATALTRNSCSRPATLPASIARCGSSHARQASSLAARPSPPR